MRKNMRKLLDDAPVNAMEIVLSVFFWSFYEVGIFVSLQFSFTSGFCCWLWNLINEFVFSYEFFILIHWTCFFTSLSRFFYKN